MKAWTIVLSNKSEKFLSKIPLKDATRVIEWTLKIERGDISPLSGDIKYLKKGIGMYRKRIGNYRVFFDIYKDRLIIYIMDIKRRTSTTYK